MILKIIDLIAFSLSFAKETIFLCFSRFFLIIDLYFLIHAVIAQIFYPTVDLAIPPYNEASADIEGHPLTT